MEFGFCNPKLESKSIKRRENNEKTRNYQANQWEGKRLKTKSIRRVVSQGIMFPISGEISVSEGDGD